MMRGILEPPVARNFLADEFKAKCRIFFFRARKDDLNYTCLITSELRCVPKIPGGCVAAVSSPGRSRSMIEICFARADRRSRENEKEKEKERDRLAGSDGEMEKERERITGRVQTDRVENPLLY